jgi:hypothetical protein
MSNNYPHEEPRITLVPVTNLTADHIKELDYICLNSVK